MTPAVRVTDQPCVTCGGVGSFLRFAACQCGHRHRRTVTCHRCSGTGAIKSVCRYCAGLGVVTRRSAIGAETILCPRCAKGEPA
jgi:DnaJ-class molecular chaperone